MSSLKSISVLLCLASVLFCGCLARPLIADDSAANEVTSQETIVDDDYGNNDAMQQFAPVVGGAFYKQRRAYYAAPPQAAPTAQLWRSSFLQRFYNFYPMATGGGNYLSNEVMPLSTYEIIEPEAMY
ncbi:GH10302 [Drosophila grimshawi]|uniref:GH10302 n=2 Tax=Drosophila grimshawi TaxID=7222 RepID=B4JAE1_DROGR|nr:GH10302 [Drosophila grimshawi]